MNHRPNPTPREGPFDRDRPARLAMMISGGGRTALNLAERMASGELPAEPAVVIASRPCAGADRARRMGLPTLLIPGEIPADRLDRVLRDHGTDWVALCGYLRLVQIPDAFADRVVNIHPALLPKFGGPGMHGTNVHRAVIDAGEEESGCTVHLCDAQYDTGPIVLRRRCPVLADDTPESLANRVFEQELIAYPEAIRMLLANEWTADGSEPIEHACETDGR